MTGVGLDRSVYDLEYKRSQRYYLSNDISSENTDSAVSSVLVPHGPATSMTTHLTAFLSISVNEDMIVYMYD